MQYRKVIEVAGLNHGANPIPVGVVVRDVLYTGTVSGVDRSTGEVPVDKTTEFANAFENLGAVLDAANASWASIAKVDVLMRDRGDRPILNDAWLQRFPEEHDRPVRHVHEAKLPGDYNIQIQIIAAVGE